MLFFYYSGIEYFRCLQRISSHKINQVKEVDIQMKIGNNYRRDGIGEKREHSPMRNNSFTNQIATDWNILHSVVVMVD